MSIENQGEMNAFPEKFESWVFRNTRESQERIDQYAQMVLNINDVEKAKEVVNSILELHELEFEAAAGGGGEIYIDSDHAEAAQKELERRRKELGLD